MAIDISAGLLSMSPVGAFSLGKGGASSLERERLELMQQQFAETRRQNAVSERLSRDAEAGAQARAELQQQVQQEKIAADARAAKEAEKRKLMAEVQKYRDAGDVEGIEALMGSMQASGMGIQRLGEDEFGLPSYQIDFDAEQAAQEENAGAYQASSYGYGPNETAVESLDRLGALGYPSVNERGNLDEPNLDVPITTEDAYERGLAASTHYEETGEPLRQPDQADIMGAVPKNVIDFGAMQAQAARRLDPALGALQRAYPERLQDSVGETNDAARGMALPAPAALELATKLRTGPDAAMGKQFDEEADKAKAAAAAEPKPLDVRKAAESFAEGGEARAKEVFDNQGLSGVYARSKAAQSIVTILEDEDPNNDLAIAFELPNMLGSRGAQSNKDLAVALGIDAMSTVDKILERVTGIIKGGFTEMRKETLIGIVQNKMEMDDELVYNFLDAIDESAGKTQDADVARGLRDYAERNVPAEYREAWLKHKEGDVEEPEPGARQGTTTVDGAEAQHDPNDVEPADAEPAGAIGDDDEFLDALHTAADGAGINADSILPLIGYESGGDPKVQNKQGSSARGLIQFLDSTAQQYTNPKTGKKFTGSEEFAELSRVEQAPFIVQYLKDRGITDKHDQGDMYVAIAGPAALNEKDSFEVYKKGTDNYRKNTGWDLDSDGVITRDELYRYGMGERKGAKGKTASGEGKKASAPAKAKSRLDSDVDDIFGG